MPEAVNHYIYCFNDPLVYVDGDGAWPKILTDIGNSIKDAATGLVTQIKEDPRKFAATVATGLVVGVATAAVAAACVAAAPVASAASKGFVKVLKEAGMAFASGFGGGAAADATGQYLNSNKTGRDRFRDINWGHAIGTGIFGGSMAAAGYGASRTRVGQFVSKGLGKYIYDPVYKATSNGIEAIGRFCSGETGVPPKYDGEYFRKLGKGSQETYEAYIKNNPGKTIDDYLNLLENSSPWPDGYDPNKHMTTLKSGDKFNMVLDSGQDVTSPGGFGIKEDVPSVDFARNDMAIRSDWKADCGKVATYRVKDGVTLTCPSGPIGPQIDMGTNQYLPGNNSVTQYDLFYGMGRINRNDYIEYVPGTLRPLK